MQKRKLLALILTVVGATHAYADGNASSEIDLMTIGSISTGSSDESYGSDYIRTFGIGVSSKVSSWQGSCERAFVDWGDGTSPVPVSGNFPLKAKHTYQEGGLRNITVTAAPGFKCLGQAVFHNVYAYPKDAKFSDITPKTVGGEINQEVKFEVAGSGICDKVSIDLGDNTILNIGKVQFNPGVGFKYAFTAKYKKAGSYNVYVKDTGTSACGNITAKVTITAPLALTPVLPLILPTAVTTAPAANKPAAGKPVKPCKKTGKPGIGDDCAP